MIDYSELLLKQRNFFNTGKTKDYSYRLNALNALEKRWYISKMRLMPLC